MRFGEHHVLGRAYLVCLRVRDVPPDSLDAATDLENIAAQRDEDDHWPLVDDDTALVYTVLPSCMLTVCRWLLRTWLPASGAGPCVPFFFLSGRGPSIVLFFFF